MQVVCVGCGSAGPQNTGTGDAGKQDKESLFVWGRIGCTLGMGKASVFTPFRPSRPRALDCYSRAFPFQAALFSVSAGRSGRATRQLRVTVTIGLTERLDDSEQ
jgi:hypothetical protein